MVAASPPLVSRCLSRDYPRTISGDSYAELSTGSPPDFGSGEPTSVEKALRSEIATLRDDRQAVLDALEAVRRERHSSESPPRGADRGTEDGGREDRRVRILPATDGAGERLASDTRQSPWFEPARAKRERYL
jgi:hypothetical protein